MIRLTNDASGEAGNPLYITPEAITSIRPWGGTTRIDTTDSKYFVTESPAEVIRKALEWRLAMERYKALAKALASASENFIAYNNELDEEEKTLLVLAGLEEPNHDT